MCRYLLLAGLIWAAGGATSAAGAEFYGGAPFTKAHVDIQWPAGATGNRDRNDGFKIIAGVQPLKQLAAELNYIDAGGRARRYRWFAPRWSV